MGILKIAITKGKEALDVETDDLPEAVYARALAEGLKVLLNAGMSKITAKDIPNEDERKAEAMLKAKANLADLRAGKLKTARGAAAAGKVAGVVMTEAMRLARNLVKDEMKRQGLKVSYVAASDITVAAKALIAATPDIVKQAEANLAERAKVAVTIDVSAIPVDANKVAKAAEAKAKKAEQLSAKQAGQTVVAAKAKPAKGKGAQAKA